MKRGALFAASLAVCVVLAPALSQAQVPPPVPQPAPPPVPQPAPAVYFYNDGGKQVGPLTLDQILLLIINGKIRPETLMWKAGMPSWIPAREFPEIDGPPPPKPPQPQVTGGPCGGKHVFLADDFSRRPINSPNFIVEDSKLKAKASPGNIQWFLYAAKTAGNFDACVTAQVPHKFIDGDHVSAGLIFGAESLKNFYAFAISAAGTVALFNVRNQDFHDRPIDWRPFPAMKSDPGSKNALRVSVKGNTATFFVNGVQFATADLQMPNGGGQVGLMFASEKSRTDAWKFSNLRVSDPAP